MSDWFAIHIISGVLFGQGSTSIPGLLARWYFKWAIPAKIFLPQRLHVLVYWEVALVQHTPTLDPIPSAFCLDENIKPMAEKKNQNKHTIMQG
jgi:hypothetical protein